MLDASLLLMPLIGFIVADRPEVAVDVVGDGQDAGVRQPRVPLRPQGVARRAPGSEGTFSLCTFFYVDALARSGRLDDARLVFEKMLTYANHLGLFAEEIGAHGRAARQLPAGVHAPRVHRRGRQSRSPARPRRRPRSTSSGRGQGGQPPARALRRVLVPLALAQFICSFAGSNMNVMINDISTDLNTTVQGVQTAITSSCWSWRPS